MTNRQRLGGWFRTTLGSIAETTSGTTPSRTRKDFYEKGHICWVKTGELKDNTIYSTEEHITDRALEETSLKLLPIGTLLIAMYGQGQTRGRTALLGVPATINQACFAVLPNPQVFETEFLQLWFLLNYQRLRNETEGRGGNQSNLNGDSLKKQIVPIPPLDEQRRIISVAKKHRISMQQARAAAQTQLDSALALTDLEIASVYTTLSATHGLVMLENLLIDANYGTSVKCSDTRPTLSFPVLRIPNIVREEISWDDLKYGVLESGELQNKLLQTGDILIVRTNGSSDLVGRCAVVSELSEPTSFASYLIRLRVDRERANPNYIKLMLTHLRNDGHLLDFANTSAGQYNVSVGRLKNARLPLPSIEAQDDIVRELDAKSAGVRNLITTLTEQLQLIEELPTAILQQAFEGKLER